MENGSASRIGGSGIYIRSKGRGEWELQQVMEESARSRERVILLAGLQGVGKTTVCANLAYYLKKLGKSCMLVAADVYRPVAIDQLKILGEQVGVPVYAVGTDVKPSEIAKQGLEEAKKHMTDVVIVDTAGRLQIDKAMMDELKEVKQALTPTEVLLVVDAMTGQEAAALVTTFNLEIGITGAILTKLDGDSRGGAALSVREEIEEREKVVRRMWDVYTHSRRIQLPRFLDLDPPPLHSKIFHKRMPPEAIDFASRLLQYSPSLRCTAVLVMLEIMEILRWHMGFRVALMVVLNMDLVLFHMVHMTCSSIIFRDKCSLI